MFFFLPNQYFFKVMTLFRGNLSNIVDNKKDL